MKKIIFFCLCFLFSSCKENSLQELNNDKDNISKLSTSQYFAYSKGLKISTINRPVSLVVTNYLSNNGLYGCVFSKMGHLNIGSVFDNNIVNDYNIDVLCDTFNVKVIRWRFKSVKDVQLFYDLSRKFACLVSMEDNFLERGQSDYFVVGKYLYIVKSYDFLSMYKVIENLKTSLMREREFIYNSVNLDSIHLYRY